MKEELEMENELRDSNVVELRVMAPPDWLAAFLEKEQLPEMVRTPFKSIIAPPLSAAQAEKVELETKVGMVSELKAS